MEGDDVLFVATGKPCQAGDYRQVGPDHGKELAINANDPGVAYGWPGYRAVPFRVSEAVERVLAVWGWEPGKKYEGIEAKTLERVTNEVRRAILGAPSPEPTGYEIEAAREIIRQRKAAVSMRSDDWAPTVDGLASIIAAARVRAEEGRGT